ncbi:hypothetical protein F4556_000612 [Kitasatospora gansuensis]|uniref:GatB/YqeY domain-containing protein n=1 Tax=Kitasatospora gansuensis TaxID=258050 RepID=A0A7W7S7F9_9ACTN|nr:hypothetical protein [Kitasatospora gansuensis]MBB4945077.1 hypothetical protein [Kitasatospora gansuensis]
MPTDPTSSASTAPLRERLRAALPAAMKARDKVATSALRSALAAIENAEAVDVPAGGGGSGLAIERIAVGLGTAEAERRVLTEARIEQIVRAEITEREAAAAGYDRTGPAERAALLRAEIAVLSAQVG